MSRISIAAVAVLTLGSAAMAADAPVVSSATEMAPASSEWGGFYAGVLGTAGVVTSTNDDVGYWEYGSNLDQDFGAYGIGATVGYNAQSGGIVYGIEADASWLKGSEDTYRFGDTDYQTGIDALVTLRGRLGITVDNLLLYGTAGVAAASLNYDWDQDNGGYTWSSDAWQFGYTVGAGFEYALDDRLSIKTEYLFASVQGDTTYLNEDNFGDDFPFDLSATASLFRAGLNYKF